MSVEDFYSILRIVSVFFISGLAGILLFWVCAIAIKDVFKK